MAKREIHYEIIPSTLEQYLSPIADVVRETVITQIPNEFIEYLEVEYTNGTVIRVGGEDISEPIVIGGSPSATKETQNMVFKNILNIKIYINFHQMEKSIDDQLNAIFGKNMFLED
jgi:hypothetical protein